MIVSDTGTEFTSNTLLAWQEEFGIEWHCITPGKPMQNGFVESFSGIMPRKTFSRQVVATLQHSFLGNREQ